MSFLRGLLAASLFYATSSLALAAELDNNTESAGSANYRTAIIIFSCSGAAGLFVNLAIFIATDRWCSGSTQGEHVSSSSSSRNNSRHSEPIILSSSNSSHRDNTDNVISSSSSSSSSSHRDNSNNVSSSSSSSHRDYPNNVSSSSSNSNINIGESASNIFVSNIVSSNNSFNHRQPLNKSSYSHTSNNSSGPSNATQQSKPRNWKEGALANYYVSESDRLKEIGDEAENKLNTLLAEFKSGGIHQTPDEFFQTVMQNTSGIHKAYEEIKEIYPECIEYYNEAAEVLGVVNIKVVVSLKNCKAAYESLKRQNDLAIKAEDKLEEAIEAWRQRTGN